MSVFDLIKKLAGGTKKVSLETYLEEAKKEEIQYPLTPVKALIEQGKIRLDNTSKPAFLVVVG